MSTMVRAVSGYGRYRGRRISLLETRGSVPVLLATRPITPQSHLRPGRARSNLRSRATRAPAAPLHYHHNEDDLSYVLTGRFRALLGNDVVIADAGTWVFKSRKQWRTFWNAGETPCEIMKSSPLLVLKSTFTWPRVAGHRHVCSHQPEVRARDSGSKASPIFASGSV